MHCYPQERYTLTMVNYLNAYIYILQIHISAHMIDLIIDNYVRQTSRVSWEMCISLFYITKWCQKCNSPIIFTKYISYMIWKLLEDSGYECYVKNIPGYIIICR